MSKTTHEAAALMLKNYQINFLGSILDVPLHGKESRARGRFINLLQPRAKEIEVERVKLLKEFADKDDKGEPIIEGESYKLSKEGLEKFQKEYGELLSEDFIIDVLDSNRSDIATVKEIILNSKKEFGIVEGASYEQLCKNFE